MAKTVKMIVTDLDGTLLRDDKTVSERNRLTISRCREAGIKVIFATGRAYRTKIVPQDWFDGYVRSNGAYAYADETEVYKRTFSDEVMSRIVEACNERGIATETRSGEQINLPDISSANAEYVRSLLLADLYLVVLNDGFGQIMHKEAKKVLAVEALAQHWNIDRTEVAAFGDDLNDIEMLSWAGYGIAMGNALDEVAAVADEICPCNEDDGFSVWIEQNVIQ